MILRTPAVEDAAAVLALNAEFVDYLSPMDADRWALLSAAATFPRIVSIEGVVAAFTLVFSPEDVYDSANFAWFREKYARFWYLDRIVVGADFQRRGIGQVIYDAAESGALGAGQQRLVCEVNAFPANDGSLAFHAQRGYVEVGRRGSEAEGKVVAMLAKELDS